jgi:hypothetical protein
MIDNTWTNIGIFATVLSVGITILVFIVKGSHQIGRWEKRQDSQEKAMEKLEDKIERVDNKIEQVRVELDNKIEQVDDKIEQVKVELVEIKVNAKETTTKLDLIYNVLKISPTMQKNSPLALSETGEISRKRIKADEIFEKYKDKLISEFDKEQEKNAYDLEIEAFRVVKDVLPKLLSEAELNTIKNEAYRLGCIVPDIIYIFQILLRDFLLNKKGIRLEDIDKDDSNKQ